MLTIGFAPLFGWPPIGLAAALAAAMLGYALLRGASGWPARALVFAALLAALANPVLIEEERRHQPDIVAVVVDESPSQQVAERPADTARALDHVVRLLATLPDVEPRVIRAGAPSQARATDGTQLFDAVRRAMADIPKQRLAGTIMITDGQVHDVPQAVADLPAPGPLHVLLTGARGDRDRRIAVVEAPKFGIVGKQVELLIRVEDEGTQDRPASLRIARDGRAAESVTAAVGEVRRVTLALDHAEPNIVEISAEAIPGEITTANNRTVLTINGVRERLRVLLVSGEPHPGERVWRNLLKADPSVDLVHFTILRPPEKQDSTPVQELSLIAFPIRELFEVKLEEFDLIIFDRYRSRGVLPALYLRNIANFVRAGGAVLEAAGPAFATPLGLHNTPLGELLPGAPTGQVLERGLKPTLTETGRRHPITADLPGSQTDSPPWGRWFRQIEVRNQRGMTLMTGIGERPLLIVERIDKGRVAQLLSDHIWLWARGFEGGGPHSELLRRLAHWLMKEPDLEEDELRAHGEGGQLVVTRRSVTGKVEPVEVTAPSGAKETVVLRATKDGRAIATLPAAEAGVYRVTDGTRTALTAVGTLNPLEYADMRATPDRLAGMVQATGGRIGWIADGLPTLRRVRPGRTSSGTDWIGLPANRTFSVTGVTETPLIPAAALLVLAIGALLLAWRREGR